jgi:hypothetical protein
VFEWLRAPAFFDAVLVLLAIEAVVLARLVRRAGSAPLARSYQSFLIAGAGFVVAMRGVAAAWPTWTIAAGLTVALLAHLWHLRSLAR